MPEKGKDALGQFDSSKRHFAASLSSRTALSRSGDAGVIGLTDLEFVFVCTLRPSPYVQVTYGHKEVLKFSFVNS